MKYILYCDLKTVSCTADVLEKIVSENSISYTKISNELYTFKQDEDEYRAELCSVSEYMTNELLDKYLNKDSICFAFCLDKMPSDFFMLIPE